MLKNVFYNIQIIEEVLMKSMVGFSDVNGARDQLAGTKKRTGQHPSFSLTKPIKLIKPKLMN